MFAIRPGFVQESRSVSGPGCSNQTKTSTFFMLDVGLSSRHSKRISVKASQNLERNTTRREQRATFQSNQASMWSVAPRGPTQGIMNNRAVDGWVGINLTVASQHVERKTTRLLISSHHDVAFITDNSLAMM